MGRSSDYARNQQSRKLFDEVLVEGARLFEIEPEMLDTSRRSPKALVHARFAVCKAMRMHDVSFERIGVLMGRHHTSIMYAVEQADLLMAEDTRFAQMVNLLANFENQPRPQIEKLQHYDVEMPQLDNIERRTYKAIVKNPSALTKIESEIESIKGARPHFILSSENGVVFTATDWMAAQVTRLPNVIEVMRDGFTLDC